MKFGCKKYCFAFLNIFMAAIIALLPSCKAVKLSDADDTLARGEFFEASKMYRKVYNRLTKPYERPLRGEVAYKLCT